MSDAGSGLTQAEWQSSKLFSTRFRQHSNYCATERLAQAAALAKAAMDAQQIQGRSQGSRGAGSLRGQRELRRNWLPSCFMVIIIYQGSDTRRGATRVASLKKECFFQDVPSQHANCTAEFCAARAATLAKAARMAPTLNRLKAAGRGSGKACSLRGCQLGLIKANQPWLPECLIRILH